MFLGINMFLALLRAHFNPRCARAKMILSRAKNIFMPANVNSIVIIIRVHPGFSLVENCDLLEDRRTLTPLQRQANHSNFRMIDGQWRALSCIDHDHVKWLAKVFSSHYKAYFGKVFHIFIIKNK